VNSLKNRLFKIRQRLGATAVHVRPQFNRTETPIGTNVNTIANTTLVIATPEIRTLNQNTLDLTNLAVTNNSFDIVEKNGISVYRPEIISINEFNSVFEQETNNLKDTVSDTNQILELINYQIQTNSLREDTLKKMLTEMNSSSTNFKLNKISSEFNSKLLTLQKVATFYGYLIQQTNIVKNSLEIKDIPNSLYGPGNLSIKEFYNRYMQFSEGEYNSFTETKVFNQLISDMRNVLESFSYSLFDTVDSDRNENHEPFKIDKSYTLPNNFSFKPSMLTSNGTEIKNASNNATLTSFLSSLPPEPSDRIKVLCNFLSKELRVSKALGRPDIRNILSSKFNQSDTNNPFDNIIGEVGDTIFEKPLGENSLASFSYVRTGDKVVLPFENTYIDSTDLNTSNIYIPGSSYFGDSILNVSSNINNNTFNYEPFSNYANNFNDKLTSALSVLNKMFEFDNINSSLTQESIIDLFLVSFKQAIEKMVDNTHPNRDQMFVLSLFKLASTNTKLKNHLFDFCILILLAISTPDNERKIFEHIKRDIPTINSLFSFKDKTTIVNLESGISFLYPYVMELAEIIEDNVFEILYNNPNFRNTRLNGTLDTSSVSFTGTTFFRNDSNNHILRFIYGDIKDTLIKLLNTSGLASVSLVQVFSEIMTKLDVAASEGSNSLYLIEDNTYRTRYNFLGTSSIMLVVFEILCSFTKFLDINYFKSTDVLNGNINTNTTTNLAIFNHISLILSENSRNTTNSITTTNANIIIPGNSSATSSLITTGTFNGTVVSVLTGIAPNVSITVIREKLKSEDLYIKNALNILSVINTRLKDALSSVIVSFSNEHTRNFIVENNIRPEELKILTNPSQLRTSFWILNKYQNAVLDANTKNLDKILISDSIKKSVKNAMLLLLKESKFLKGTKDIKLFSIGIPSGFTNQMVNRIDRNNINNSTFLSKEFDVIKVKLYKRDLRYDDIIFIPKIFYFDLSLYPMNFYDIVKINEVQEITWSIFSRNLFLKDYENINSVKNININNIISNEKYSFLTNEQKIEMFNNHLESMFLKIYVNLTSGFKLDEDTFSNEVVDILGNMNQEVYDLIYEYITNVKNLQMTKTDNFKTLLNDLNVSQIAKDMITTMSFGNLLFQSDSIRKKVLSQKMFDRVFTLAVDAGSFEIDFNKTLLTQSGKSAFTKANLQNAITVKNNRYYMKQKNETDFIFEDYFLTIENNFNG